MRRQQARLQPTRRRPAPRSPRPRSRAFHPDYARAAVRRAPARRHAPAERHFRAGGDAGLDGLAPARARPTSSGPWAGVEHESNVLRVPSSAGTRSDTIVIAGVGFRADKRYGLQRFRADVEANTYRYDKSFRLNYSLFNYALAWDWSFTPRLHGVVSADRKQYREVTTDPVTFVNASDAARSAPRSPKASTSWAPPGACWRRATHTQVDSTRAATPGTRAPRSPARAWAWAMNSPPAPRCTPATGAATANTTTRLRAPPRAISAKTRAICS